MMGRPPKPIEHHRRVGRGPNQKADGRAIATGEVVPLPMADRTPELPDVIPPGGAGADLWERVWHSAITWISPHSDLVAVVRACQLADDLEAARFEWRSTMDPKQARVMLGLSKQFTDALSVLGFNPVARARLGVAEVKKMSVLQQLVERRQAAAQR